MKRVYKFSLNVTDLETEEEIVRISTFSLESLEEYFRTIGEKIKEYEENLEDEENINDFTSKEEQDKANEVIH